MSIKNLLKSIYRKSGISGAPPNSYLFYLLFYGRVIYGRLLRHQPLFRGNHSYDWLCRTVEHGKPCFQDNLPFPGNTPLPKLYYGEHYYFDVGKLVTNQKIKRLCLVFFMGIGDYFYTTPVLRYLRESYPSLKLVAYVPDSFDPNNSPLVRRLLEHNPDIDEVNFFHGNYSAKYWKNYDISTVYEAEQSSASGVLPMLYLYDRFTKHRVNALLQNLGLPEFTITPTPIISKMPALRGPASSLLKKIEAAVTQGRCHEVMFIQLDARSSKYNYPADFAARVIQEFIGQGIFCLSVTPVNIQSSLYANLDIKAIPIEETIGLLQEISGLDVKLRAWTVVSAFWAISAGLGIPNLGMHHLDDYGIHNVWYPNIWTITHLYYHSLPASRQFLASEAEMDRDERGFPVFHPDFVLRCANIFLQNS